jgi:transcriptional regulator with GAF, ATPase, and Fis domain
VRRRSRASSKLAKTRSRKARTLRAARNSSSSVASQETELARLTRELHEAQEQQVATSEVLRVISSSPGDLAPVFKAMLENAVRLCEAKFGMLLLLRDKELRMAAIHGAPRAFREAFRREPKLHPQFSPAAPVLETKSMIHVADLNADESFSKSRIAKLAGARTFIGVPMLKKNELVGVIGIYRQEVRPFTDKQIELVQNFAAQALIAIENTRLLNELRDSLQRQTATSDVLDVISKSPGDLNPVYQAILENATRICEAKFGVLNLHENGALMRMGAMHNVPQAFAEWLQGERGGYKPIAGSLPDRVIQTKQVSYTADNATEANPGRAAILGRAIYSLCANAQE